jgi:hypothetical protein
MSETICIKKHERKDKRKSQRRLSMGKPSQTASKSTWTTSSPPTVSSIPVDAAAAVKCRSLPKKPNCAIISSCRLFFTLRDPSETRWLMALLSGHIAAQLSWKACSQGAALLSVTMMAIFLGSGILAQRVVTFPSSPTATFPITVRTLCHKPVAPSKVSAKASSPRPCFTRFRGVTGEAGVTEESDSVARGLLDKAARGYHAVCDTSIVFHAASVLVAFAGMNLATML